jgi:hypothetical protein
VAFARRTFETATAPVVAAPGPEVEHTSNPLKTAWLRFGADLTVTEIHRLKRIGKAVDELLDQISA